jgi:hypothetical protein
MTYSAPSTSVPNKAMVYWRKNYLFGVARPGALVFDGATLTCIDNELAPVFSAPISSVGAKKGFGIFKLFINGERVSFLTPVGGSPSPAPSAALLNYLNTRAPLSPSGGQAGASGLAGAGRIMGGAAGDAATVAGAFAQVGVVINYAQGMKPLNQFLTAIGALKR